jgi:hypothetical protein
MDIKYMNMDAIQPKTLIRIEGDRTQKGYKY